MRISDWSSDVCSSDLRLSYAIGADFSYEIYRRTLHQPYAVHVSRNSSQIISGTGKANAVISSLVTPLLTLIGSSLIMLAILAALLVVDPVDRKSTRLNSSH